MTDDGRPSDLTSFVEGLAACTHCRRVFGCVNWPVAGTGQGLCRHGHTRLPAGDNFGPGGSVAVGETPRALPL